MEEQKPIESVTAIVVDGLGSLQSKEYMAKRKEGNKAEYAEWSDYGVSLYNTYSLAKTVGKRFKVNIIPVQILGKEGTGKTTGAMKLDPMHTIYLNCEEKPLTWRGWRKAYNSVRKNYFELGSYTDVDNYIEQLVEKYAATSPNIVLFLLGHVEEYKNANGGMSERLKIMGKQATKFNIEGSLTHCFYTFIDPGKTPTDPERYQLITVNSGANTARTPLGEWDAEKIPNDFQKIVDKISEEYL